MRYIVKCQAGEFGAVRVLAESAGEALKIATDMVDRDAPGISILDADGTVLSVDDLRVAAATEAAQPEERGVG